MIKMMVWSCVILVAVTLLLYWLYAIGALSIMAFALLSGLAFVGITLAHLFYLLNRKARP